MAQKIQRNGQYLYKNIYYQELFDIPNFLHAINFCEAFSCIRVHENQWCENS